MKSDLLLLTLFYFDEFFMQSFWVSVMSSWATFDLFLKATHTAAFLFLAFTSFLSIFAAFELDPEDTGDPTDSTFEPFLFYLLFRSMSYQYLWMRVLGVNA